jgi:hypothetical protein
LAAVTFHVFQEEIILSDAFLRIQSTLAWALILGVGEEDQVGHGVKVRVETGEKDCKEPVNLGGETQLKNRELGRIFIVS